MLKFILEREIANTGELINEQLKYTTQSSCAVLNEMQWLHC